MNMRPTPASNFPLLDWKRPQAGREAASLSLQRRARGRGLFCFLLGVIKGRTEYSTVQSNHSPHWTRTGVNVDHRVQQIQI